MLNTTSVQATQPITNACTYHLWVQAEMRRPRFEEGLEGVLALADSISLKDTLAAADLDSSGHDKAIPTTKEAVVQSVEGLVAEAASIV